jgi:OFA family oxalate/formate antiporter-like MFS transporter
MSSNETAQDPEQQKQFAAQGVRVLIAGSILMLLLGILYVWSVFVIPFKELTGWREESIKLTSSFLLSFYVLGILAGGKIQVKKGTSVVCLAGGLLLALGMLIASFVPPGAPWLIYSYGIIGGFGVGMGYTSVVTCGQKWFPNKRGLATGISVFTFGFSSVIFAPLVKTLVASFELVSTFRILCVISLAVTLAVFKFINLPNNMQQGGAAAKKLLEKKQYTTPQMLRNKNFYMITLSLMAGNAAYFILNPAFVTLMRDKVVAAGGSLEMGVRLGGLMVMIAGIANAAGRILLPILSEYIGRKTTAFIIYGLTAVCTLAIIFSGGPVMIALVAVVSMCYGAASGVFPLLTTDFFGIENFGTNYGAVMIGFAASALLFPFVFAPIQSLTAKFIALTIVAAIGSILMLFPKEDAAPAQK